MVSLQEREEVDEGFLMLRNLRLRLLLCVSTLLKGRFQSRIMIACEQMNMVSTSVFVQMEKEESAAVETVLYGKFEVLRGICRFKLVIRCLVVALVDRTLLAYSG